MKSRYVLMTIAVALLLVGASVFATVTDDRIISSAKQSYVFRTYLAGDDINIQSVDGQVTLTGTALDEGHIWWAQEVITGLPGVNSVNNKLEVKGVRPVKGSDAWINMQVKNTLLIHRNVSSANTNVNVREGIVTLNGVADNQAQKDLTAEYAKDIEGVKDVKNDMTIAKTPAQKQTMSEKLDDASITTQVKFALLTHRSTSVMSTKVETQNGVVTLYGKADSAAEKSLATKLVSDIYGVDSVKNNMVVETTK